MKPKVRGAYPTLNFPRSHAPRGNARLGRAAAQIHRGTARLRSHLADSPVGTHRVPCIRIRKNQSDLSEHFRR